jgi:hypothetical protein
MKREGDEIWGPGGNDRYDCSLFMFEYLSRDGVVTGTVSMTAGEPDRVRSQVKSTEKIVAEHRLSSAL